MHPLPIIRARGAARPCHARNRRPHALTRKQSSVDSRPNSVSRSLRGAGRTFDWPHVQTPCQRAPRCPQAGASLDYSHFVSQNHPSAPKARLLIKTPATRQASARRSPVQSPCHNRLLHGWLAPKNRILPASNAFGNKPASRVTSCNNVSVKLCVIRSFREFRPKRHFRIYSRGVCPCLGCCRASSVLLS